MKNLTNFFACDKIIVVGESWMMKGDVKENCKKINEIVKGL